METRFFGRILGTESECPVGYLKANLDSCAGKLREVSSKVFEISHVEGYRTTLKKYLVKDQWSINQIFFFNLFLTEKKEEKSEKQKVFLTT